jgi:CDP-paratose 2-epimerase
MKIVITGGAGFIGSNAANYYLQKKAEVVVFDNLSRAHTQKNLSWLTSRNGNLTFIHGDIRSNESLGKLMPFLKKADAVLHLAGQVAVTTSITNPREDFEVNALGTLNLLEAMRFLKSRAKLIYSSTNKVYGSMEDVPVVTKTTRYEYTDLPHGVSEFRNLDFHSPYGCSKGAADQYVHDYGRIYGLDTVVMRQSCIYGPRQFGVEDQGWVAWFLIAAILNKPITIYGDGKQVRDLLYIDDLVRAYDMAIAAGKKTRGRIYNIGGGAKNTLSVWREFEPLVHALHKKAIPVIYKGWRAGDQRVFIADIRLAKREFGWEPKTKVADGVQQLYDWIAQNKSLFR